MEISTNKVIEVQENEKVSKEFCILFFNAIFQFISKKNLIDEEFYEEFNGNMNSLSDEFLEKMIKYNFIKD